MSVRAVIAEDERAQREDLRAALADLWPALEIVAECEDGLSAMEAVHALKPDVVFLDIRMPGVSGLEVARAAGAFAHVVLITAYEEFAISAFESGAADYLLKPVRRDRLATTITRLQKRLADGHTADLTGIFAALQSRLAPPESRRISWISASIGDTVRMIAIDDVLFFRSEDKYTCVATAEGSAHIRTPLKDLLAQLDPDIFWQVHRSVIVRVSAIRTIRRDSEGKLGISVAGHPERLPVSAAFQDRFRPM